MTALMTAAQQALDFIRWSQFVPCRSEPFPEPPSTAPQVEAALKAALVEPVQEPVAWMCSDPDLAEKGYSRFSSRCEGAWNIPVYTSPPQRKPPATIDEMFDRMDKAPKGVFFGHDPMTIWMEAWRAAEQHHGIT